MKLHQRVGAMLRRERLAKGLTQQQVQRRTKIAQSELSQIEGGNVNITLATLDRLARAIGMKRITIDIDVGRKLK